MHDETRANQVIIKNPTVAQAYFGEKVQSLSDYQLSNNFNFENNRINRLPANKNITSNVNLNNQIGNVFFERNQIARPFTRHIQWMQTNNIILPHHQNNYMDQIKNAVKKSNEYFSNAKTEFQQAKPKTANKNNDIKVRSIKLTQSNNKNNKLEDNPLFEKSFTYI